MLKDDMITSFLSKNTMPSECGDKSTFYVTMTMRLIKTVELKLVTTKTKLTV